LLSAFGFGFGSELRQCGGTVRVRQTAVSYDGDAASGGLAVDMPCVAFRKELTVLLRKQGYRQTAFSKRMSSELLTQRIPEQRNGGIHPMRE
jgi:hypothetical protein